MRRLRRRLRRAFTLIEVLLAVALGALLMTAVTSFLVGMAEIWGEGSDERLFEKHARGISRFLEQSFMKVGSRYTVDGEENENETPSTPVFWTDWPGDESRTTSYLSFELDESPGALVWPDEPLPHILCSLDFDPEEGLFLLWRSRLEERFEDDPPRRTLLSPFVKDVRYHYIDYAVENPEWEIVQEPLQEANQDYILPERIELIFRFTDEKGEIEVVRQLILPKQPEGTPIL